MTRALLARSLLLLLALAGEVTAEDVPEGTLVPFDGPTNISWTLHQGEYGLYVSYPNGGLFNLTDMLDHLVMKGQPSGGGGFGPTVKFAEGQTRTLQVLQGKGAAIMARNDLGKGYYTHLTTRGTLSPGGCRAYFSNSPIDNYDLPFLVNATGENVTFAIYGAQLQFVTSSAGHLTFVVDDKDGTIDPLHVQACDKTNDTASFTIQVVSPAPGATRPSYTVPMLDGWTTLLLAAVALALALRRRG